MMRKFSDLCNSNHRCLFLFSFCSKIAQYSPSESTKLYDKAMQRRTINPFNPKATIALLQEDPKIGTQLSENEKRVLVDRYLEVSARGSMASGGTVIK